MQSIDCVREAVHKYGDMLYRLCFVMLRNTADAEDAVQETFIAYTTKSPVFSDKEHEKAWLLKVASNKCRDILRFRNHHQLTELSGLEAVVQDDESSHILEALMELPEKFRLVLILYYIDEYKVKEIAEIIKKTPSAVKMRLQKGRKLLEEKYRKEYM